MPNASRRALAYATPPHVDVGGKTCADCTQWLTDEHHRDCGVCKRVESLVHDIEGIGSVVTAWDLIECVTFADTEACEYLDPKQEVDE